MDGLGTTIYTYTSAGQLLSEDGPFARDTVTNGYYNRLRTGLGLQQPTGEWTNGFIYDSAGRFYNISSPAGTFDHYYATGSQGLIGGIALPNLSFITNFYDGDARLTATYLENSVYSVLDSSIYGYNQANQRTAFTNAAGTFVQYDYDNIGQLVLADSSLNGTAQDFLVNTNNELTNALAPFALTAPRTRHRPGSGLNRQ